MNPKLSRIAFTLVVMTNLSAFAQPLNISNAPKDRTLQGSVEQISRSKAMGGVATGGGDTCEARLQEITSDINLWIGREGHRYLQFPTGISEISYKQRMSQIIRQVKFQCLSEGDSGYPIYVGSTSKICRFISADDKVICDRKEIASLKADDQYALVHHELAGLAGLEIPNGEVSEYHLSNQISGFLEVTSVKKLAVKPRSHSTISELDYYKLVTESSESLGRKAQIGRLGQCEVINIGQTRNCNGSDSYVVRIRNLGLFHPELTNVAEESATCQQGAYQNVKEALAEGFCFNRNMGYEVMTSEGFGRLASVKKLGTCELRKLEGTQGRCNGPHSYSLYISDLGVYFPEMKPDAYSSSTCQLGAYEHVKNAYREGYCK
ncbi:hypothetical protein ACLVWU_09425 [Bdellovibrio sp. HCB290]|uniref:hypothetical protein n=1 Tax=Bdellovibrio sp. HCB290 TaxID=3394356 RepID=UPI0039B548EA